MESITGGHLEPRGFFVLLGSLRLTLVLFIGFAISIAIYYLRGDASEWWIATPLFLFSINLLCAISTNAAFRQKLPLLSFHLGLFAILVLAGLGRLTYLKGEVEVTQGEAMSPQLSRYNAGILHELAVDEIGFSLQRFDIEFDENQYKRFIRSHVSWSDEHGKTYHYTIADLEPLIQSGYRFYSTRHKGFAPIFAWRPEGSKEVVYGSIHLPAYPENEFSQSKEWLIPGTNEKLWAMLQFDELIITPGKSSKFRLPQQYQMVLRHGDKRYQLQPGDGIDLGSGRLTYLELRTWMGFVVFYDWTLPWLLSASLFSVLAIAAHYWQRAARRPWLAEEEIKDDED